MTTERKHPDIVAKLHGDEELTDQDLHKVLSIGLNFVDTEIKRNSSISEMLNAQSSAFKKLFPYVVLGRLVRLYREADEQELTKSDSYRLYGKMRKIYEKELDIPSDNENTTKLDQLIISTVCCQPELIGEDELIDEVGMNNMQTIRSWASQVVPDNPKSATEFKGIEHLLD